MHKSGKGGAMDTARPVYPDTLSDNQKIGQPTLSALWKIPFQ